MYLTTDHAGLNKFHGLEDENFQLVKLRFVGVDKIIRIVSSKSGAYEPLYTRAGELIQD